MWRNKKKKHLSGSSSHVELYICHKAEFLTFYLCYTCAFNPFMLNGLFYCISLDRPICNRKVVWLVFIITFVLLNFLYLMQTL